MKMVTIPENEYLQMKKIISDLNSHVKRVQGLPFHHKDPFERLIIAQTQIEKMFLMSKDSIIKKYDVELI